VSDELFAVLRSHYSDEEILELVITAGWYHTVAYVVNACGVEREPWAARSPRPARGRPARGASPQPR